MLASVLIRLKALVFRKRADQEIDEELRYHLDRETERNAANGMSPDDARAAARRAIGNVTIATEQARDATRWRGLEELRQDIVYALRTFRRSPQFVIAVVATIGLGLGLLSSAFTFFDAYVLRPLAVRDPYSLYELSWSERNGKQHSLTWAQYQHLEASARQDAVPFSDAFGFAFQSTRLRGRPVLGQLVTGNYFEMLGVPPALGRMIVPSDATSPGGGAVIVLAHRVWTTIFGADSSVIGARVLLNGATLTIVGVAREGFGGLTSTPLDFWIPITMIGAIGPEPELFGAREPEGIRVIGRLRRGTTAVTGAARFTSWLTAETTDRPLLERVSAAKLLARGTSIPRSPELIAVFGPVLLAFALVLAIGCANVANMMLARGMVRQREIGIRLALGAGRGRLIRQLLTEAALLALPSGVLGIIVSRAAIAASLTTMYSTVPRAYTDYLRVVPLDVDLRILGFMLASAMVAGIAFGLAPALQATRPDIVKASRGDFDTRMRPARLRNALVVAQVTSSVLLVVCAGILLSTARRTKELEPGIRTRNVLQVELASSAKPGILDALRRDPIVRGIATSSSTPLDSRFAEVSVSPRGGPSERTSYLAVSPEYFDIFDLPILNGRAFTADEARDRAGVVVVSRSTARHFWPAGDPIGQTLTISTTDPDASPLARYRVARVIGVTGDAVPGWIGLSPTDPMVYYPRPLDQRADQVLVRVGIESDQARPALERVIAAVDSNAVQDMHSIEESLAVQVYPFRAMYWVASALGVIALLLTVTGVYGVLAYVVAQRRRELGIRMALGAGASSLIALVLRQSVRLALVGSAIGVVLALGASWLLRIIFWRLVSPFDVPGFVGGPAIVVVACLLAAYVPSRRAASANPVEALRADS